MVILIIVLVLAIKIPNILHKILQVLDRKVAADEYNVLMNLSGTKDPLEMVEDMVDNILKQYCVMYIYCMDTPYVDDDTENNMVDTTLESVLKGLSDYNRRRLQYIYSSEYIEDFILKIIQLKVLDIVTGINGTYRE